MAPPTPKAVPDDTAPEGRLIDSYGFAKIYELPGGNKIYSVPTSRQAGPERRILDTIKEAATRLINVNPEEIKKPEERRQFFKRRVLEIIESSPELGVPAAKLDFYADNVVRDMIGYGPLDLLLADDALEEIMVIGPNKPVYVFHRKHEMMMTNISFADDGDIASIVDRIARDIGRRIDIKNPLLDARLPDGSRVNATIPPVSIEGSTITIRKFREDPLTIVDLARYGTLDTSVAAFLWLAVEGMRAKPANILVSGGTGSGKTSTLNVLASFIPRGERIITMEDTAEIKLPVEHWIRFETRPPGIEGSGEVDMDTLVKNSLRMRPDRIIVGEVRGHEAATLFTAMNTGHDGCLPGDALVAFTDGPKPIGAFVDGFMRHGRKEGGFEVADVHGVFVNSMDASGKVAKKPVVRVMRRKHKGKLVSVRFASGVEIRATPNHPFYMLGDSIHPVRADSVREGAFLATPRRLLLEKAEATDEEREIEYWSGLLHGDGHLRVDHREREKNGKVYACSEGTLALCTEEPAVVGDYTAFIGAQFGGAHVGCRPPSPDKMAYTLTMSGYNRALRAGELLGMPFGSRAEAPISSGHYTTAPNEFVAGLIDAEGHVDKSNTAVVFSNANTDYIRFVRHVLLANGVHSRVYPSSGGYRLYVYGMDNVRRFADAVSLRFPKKAAQLRKTLGSGRECNPNVDVIPCAHLLKQKVIEAKRLGASTHAIARAAGVSQGLVMFYKNGKRQPSPSTLSRLANAFESLGVACNDLRQLAESEIFWDRVIEVAEEEFDGYVYDLTVSEGIVSGDEPHNFVADGVLVCNSMGTVHANSATETLVRLKSPPMSVPELMLAALNLIIVQKRIHDRRKGTIRRVTEVAEVTGVLEGRPQLVYLYEWDAATDTIKSTGVPSKYLQELGRYTGASYVQIQDEIRQRKEFLDKLLSSGVRDLESVSQKIHDFKG
jgi:flagellar protein FlaI